MPTLEKCAALGWPNCLSLSDGPLSLVITTDVGPRIISLRWQGEDELLYQNPSELGAVGGSDWRIYGGHRLWVAPEDVQRTYAPDNVSVTWDWDGRDLVLRAEADSAGVAKTLRVQVDGARGWVAVDHCVENTLSEPQEMAVWALTAMGPGGRALIPAEPRRPHPDALLPARPLILWPYTDMADPRWRWGREMVQLQQVPGANSPQKVGVHCSLGWVAWSRPSRRGGPGVKGDGQDVVFVKTWNPSSPPSDQPDMGANLEIFTDANMLELETLGPLSVVPPGGIRQHTERWTVARLALSQDELEARHQLERLVYGMT